MIILNVNPSTKELIRKSGYLVKVKDNLGNYFCTSLSIIFSNNIKSKLSIIDYDLPQGAGKYIISVSILNKNKKSIYRKYKVIYMNKTLDDFLLL